MHVFSKELLSQGKVHSNLQGSFYNIVLLMFVNLENNYDTLFSRLSYRESYDFVPKRIMICQHVVISHDPQFNINQHHLKYDVFTIIILIVHALVST